MKILMVNKFFYIKGGSETYYFSLKKLLEEKGHTVIDFSMKDEKNFESPYSKFFVDNVDYNKEQSIIEKAINSIEWDETFITESVNDVISQKEPEFVAEVKSADSNDGDINVFIVLYYLFFFNLRIILIFIQQ